MDINANPGVNQGAALRQVLRRAAAAAAQEGDAEAAPLMNDVALMVETIATQSAIERFRMTEDEKRQARQRENRNKDIEKKRLQKKAVARANELKKADEEAAARKKEDDPLLKMIEESRVVKA